MNRKSKVKNKNVYGTIFPKNFFLNILINFLKLTCAYCLKQQDITVMTSCKARQQMYACFPFLHEVLFCQKQGEPP